MQNKILYHIHPHLGTQLIYGKEKQINNQTNLNKLIYEIAIKLEKFFKTKLYLLVGDLKIGP